MQNIYKESSCSLEVDKLLTLSKKGRTYWMNGGDEDSVTTNSCSLFFGKYEATLDIVIFVNFI